MRNSIEAARRPRLAAAFLILAAALPHTAWPDRLTLSDGTTLPGQVSRIDAEGVELVHCGARRTLLRGAVRSIDLRAADEECGSRNAASAAVLAPGAKLVVRPSRPIDAAREPIEQIFAGSIEDPVVQGEQLLIRRGAPVLLQLRSARLHITDIFLDHGWVHIDVPADPDDASDGASRPARTALPGSAPIVFTLRRPQKLLYSVRDARRQD